MTLKCWEQDPADRPTVTEVVKLLREWSVLSLSIEPTSLHGCCSYRLRTVNPSPSNLTPGSPVENTNTAASHATISQAPVNGKPTPTRSSGTPQRSAYTDFQTHETSAELSTVLNSSRELLSDKPQTPSGSANSNGDHLFSIVHGVRTVHAENHHMASTLDTRLERSGPNAVKRRNTNKIAKVTQRVISPSNPHHTSTLGART